MTHYNQIAQALENGWDIINFGKVEFDRHHLYFGHGTDNALDEALAIALYVLDCPYEDVDLRMAETLSMEDKKSILALYKKRIELRVPVPYLTHVAYFCGLSFYVNETVLIPRSPIAELIENQFSPWVNPDKVEDILELCTGSGCIAIACAYAFEKATIDATDISEDVLDIARKNVGEHTLEKQVNLIKADIFSGIKNKKYDIIVSNPPYVSKDEMSTLPKEYRHEPTLALEANEKGLALVKRILMEAKHYLKEDGVLIVEVGNSEEALIEAYPKAPFFWLSFERGGGGVFLLNYPDLNRFF